ncbi:MAG: efflux transporter outer membrane subunit [Pantoea sp.]|uniref:efflux transporter outer membrane subunit n=1 Tax=Pantoea septica TaxID=472695 RepID=UPI001C0FE332|nr:efflux transporter outer membrane subunit [Pantoea septica]MBU5376938.1 efflux transporter outer membrane subunit [Pantoea septica]MDU5838807.1 efflux transporter outer membrane subunit [Pantoea sp.]MDU6438787.1 efflux transporter outer membrane subunit [Pantoea sp.]
MKVISTCSLARPISLMTLAFWLAGCAVGPDYEAPKPQLPGGYHLMDAQQASKTAPGGVNTRWWQTFNDPQLNSLIDRAVEGNLTLQQAVLRIAGARQELAQARGGLFPSLNGSAKVTRQQLGLEGLLKANGATDQLDSETASQLSSLDQPVTLYQGSFDASWELDLWGKVRRQVELADAQTQAAIEQRNDALVSLEAEVARAYLQLRGAQATVATLEQQIAVAQQSWELTQSQQRNGLAPLTDVENARAQLSSLQAQLPQYQSQARQAMNGLAVLLGKTPGALDNELFTPKAMPALPQVVPVGIPATLARRRPDIRQAEATLHAQTANIGVSVAQLFPSLSLTGQLGVRNTDISYLDNWSSHFYSVGPSLSIPIFQGGRLVSSVKLARAQQASAALDYRQTVLTALQDVENALVSYRADQARVTALDETTGSLQRAFDLASDSYRQGISTFIDVLDAQRQLAQAQEQATQARMQSALDLVALYKALGGGWETYQKVTLPQFDVFGPAASAS